MEVYERKGKWYVVGKGRPYASKWEAEGTPNPLQSLSAVSTYKSFEEAMEVHGQDEDEFLEEEE